MSTKSYSVKGVLVGSATLVFAVCLATGQSPRPTWEKPKQAQQQNSNYGFGPSAMGTQTAAAPSVAPNRDAIKSARITTVNSTASRWIGVLLCGFAVLAAAATFSFRGVKPIKLIKSAP